MSKLEPKLAYGIDEFCKIANLGRTKLYKDIAEGRLRAVKNGRRTVILRCDGVPRGASGAQAMGQIAERPPLAPCGPRETFRLATECFGNAENSGDAQAKIAPSSMRGSNCFAKRLASKRASFRFRQISSNCSPRSAMVTYALKRLVAHARAAAQTANELAALKAGGQ